VDPNLDVLFKVISALFVPLSGVVYALWKALNAAWDRNGVEQQAHIARLEAQQVTCQACSEARQQAYKDLLSTTIKVIEQNTDAQKTQATLTELLKKLEEVRGSHVPKNA
jgi:hypothetical protein